MKDILLLRAKGIDSGRFDVSLLCDTECGDNKERIEIYDVEREITFSWDDDDDMFSVLKSIIHAWKNVYLKLVIAIDEDFDDITVHEVKIEILEDKISALDSAVRGIVGTVFVNW